MSRGLVALAVALLCGGAAAAADGLVAYDGFGNAVDWFFVYKLPEQTFSPDEIAQLSTLGADATYDITNVSLGHCNCPDPTCDNSAGGPDVGAGKGSGLCYLYADSNHPTLRYFTDVVDEATGLALECLGQQGRDPVSQTLQQIHENYDEPDVEWAFWNDQMQGQADSYYQDVCAYNSYSDESLPYTNCSTDADCGMRCHYSKSDYRECTSDDDCESGDYCAQVSCTSRALPHYNAGCSSPYAHSKGAMAFREDATGFHLQMTTPNYPDPSLGANGGLPVKLGCQLDGGNTEFAQSVFGVTLSSSDSGVGGNVIFDSYAPAFAQARACSTNTNSCNNGTAGHIMSANCTSEQTRGEAWSILDTTFNGASSQASASADIVTGLNGIEVNFLAKASEDELPPWLVAANNIDSSLAVASWLESSYGTPSICAGDDYSNATYDYCLVSDSLDIQLSAIGGAAYSIENALAATTTINGSDYSWGLFGNLYQPFTSHAKVGVASPDPTSGAVETPWLVSGDMNQQGFPCSKACDGSQGGRGGTFWSIQNDELRTSFAGLMQLACACNNDSMLDMRMCGFGCASTTMTEWMPYGPFEQQTSSGWEHIAWTGDFDTCTATSQAAYDKQEDTYTANHSPTTVSDSTPSIGFEPIFAPDTAVSVMVDLIDASESSVDIVTPSASSWSDACASYEDLACTAGCSPEDMRSDPFPLFGALLNALHRGVDVRIISNDYGSPDCAVDNNITMLPFLQLNGAEVRYYATTSYAHAKWMSFDARDDNTAGSSKTTTTTKKVIVSSVNWSKTSMTKNREAGAVLSGDAAEDAMDFMQSIFEIDWANASPLVVDEDAYDADAMATITDTSLVNVTVPDSPNVDVDGCAVAALDAVTLSAGAAVTAMANPDFAFHELTDGLNASTTSLEVYMYQITNEFCDTLIDILQTKDAEFNLTLLVSARVYDECDCLDANFCYEKLDAAGVHVRKTSDSCFSYSHQKFWIIDGKTVGFSTGNWSPTDFQPGKKFDTAGDALYPPYGEDGWQKTNRDFSLLVDGDDDIVAQFRTILTADWYANDAMPWAENAQVRCGF